MTRVFIAVIIGYAIAAFITMWAQWRVELRNGYDKLPAKHRTYPDKNDVVERVVLGGIFWPLILLFVVPQRLARRELVQAAAAKKREEQRIEDERKLDVFLQEEHII